MVTQERRYALEKLAGATNCAALHIAPCALIGHSTYGIFKQLKKLIKPLIGKKVELANQEAGSLRTQDAHNA